MRSYCLAFYITLPFQPSNTLFMQLFLDFNSVPVLEFNLSWLAQQQVKECFIVYTKSKEQVEKFIEELDIKEMKIIPRYCNPEQINTYSFHNLVLAIL